VTSVPALPETNRRDPFRGVTRLIHESQKPGVRLLYDEMITICHLTSFGKIVMEIFQ
jgi:hypothetical protein